MNRKILFVDNASPADPCSGGIASYIRHRAFVLSPLGFEIGWTNGVELAVFRESTGLWEPQAPGRAPSSLAARIGNWWLPGSPVWSAACRFGANAVELADGTGQQWPRDKPMAIGIQCHTSQAVRLMLDKAAARPDGIRHFAVRRAFLRADGVLACSHEIANLTAGYYRLHPDRFTVLHHAFSRKGELPPLPPVAAEPFFLVVGNVEIMKGVDLVVNGFRLYRARGGTAALAIAGTSGRTDSNPQVREFLAGKPFQDLVRQAGESCVRFLGKATKPQLAELRSRAMACVVGSRFDAFPMVAGEAFLSGTPLILSDRTGWRGLAERYQAARLYDPHNAEALAAAMAEMESEEARKRYRCQGERLADYLAGSELAERTANWYRILCEGRTGGGGEI